MALLLAPYNSAMRLGMGFNSYTQQLCVNDVVRKPGNVRATEDDLRAAQLTQSTDKAQDHSAKKRIVAKDSGNPHGSDVAKSATETAMAKAGSTSQASEVLEGATGSMVRTFVDGQKEVSQVVSWEASFIENSSDILKKLDVSGALSIKMEGLGGLNGKASFVDSTDIKKADINYLVHVKVTNQRLVADNVTQFSPIPYVQDGQFTDIYGDCFISGFIEGGEFDAVVSITTEETSKKWGLSGGLELKAKLGPVDVAGSVEGGKTDNSLTKGTRTKISVTWSGGGDIRPDSITEWTLTTLKQVAMGFPDAVAACPQRTSAILTKYTSLRSFHESTKKGSPLDYENAGVYTASLYDAYTDYKMMWAEIQALTSGLNTKQIELFISKAPAGLKKFADDMKFIEDEKKKQYEDALKAASKPDDSKGLNALVPLSNSAPKTKKPLEKPLKFNNLVPYDPDIFGLEVAARDCRFEMIKIVREVDAVTNDPQVASDPSRTTQFLSPGIFRLLVPTAYSTKLPSMKEWQDATDDIASKKDELEKQEKNIAELKRTLELTLITPKRNQKENLHTVSTKAVSQLHPDVQTSLSKHAHRADKYRMQTLLQDKGSISTGASFFNDLDELPLARPKEIRLFTDGSKLRGARIIYTNDAEVSHGKTTAKIPPTDDQKSAKPAVTPIAEGKKNEKVTKDEAKDSTATPETKPTQGETKPAILEEKPAATIENTKDDTPGSTPVSASTEAKKLTEHVLALGMDEVITEVEVYLAQTSENKPIVIGLALATSKCNILITGSKSSAKTLRYSMADAGQWSFRGFFGFTFIDGYEDLGVVWGEDQLTAESTTVQRAPAKNLLNMGSTLQAQTKLAMAQTKPTEHFHMGDCVHTGAALDPATSKTFSAIDHITGSDIITHIAFSVDKHRLSGLRVSYGPTKHVELGYYTEDQKVWDSEIPSSIIAAKLTVGEKADLPHPFKFAAATLTVGEKADLPHPFIHAVELVCGDTEGSLPLWPLDVSSVRYLGDFDEADKPTVHSRITEQAPKLGGAFWTLRGFYGECTGGIISRLGLVWGCA